MLGFLRDLFISKKDLHYYGPTISTEEIYYQVHGAPMPKGQKVRLARLNKQQARREWKEKRQRGRSR